MTNVHLEICSKPMVVSVDTYRNKEYLSARFMYTDRDGELKHSKNGVNIPLEGDGTNVIMVVEAILEGLNAHYGTNWCISTTQEATE